MHSSGLDRLDSARPHRWQPHARRPLPGDRAGFDRAARSYLHQLRWRREAPDHRRVAIALSLALGLHVLFVLLARQGAPPVPLADHAGQRVLQVRLIDTTAAPPPPVEMPSRGAVAPRSMATSATPAPGPAAAPVPATPPLRLYTPDGRLRVTPTAPAPAAPSPGYKQHPPQANTDVMHRNSDRLGPAPTRFGKDWVPANESLTHKGERKLGELVGKTVLRKTFHLAPGMRIHCATVLFILPVGCKGDPPDKMSAKSNDPRLDMAPANPLVPGIGPPDPAIAAERAAKHRAACEAAWRAGKRLPPDCAGPAVPEDEPSG